MKPEHKSHNLLAVTRSKAKMYEYHVPLDLHIKFADNPGKLLILAIGMLGDYAAIVSRAQEELTAPLELNERILFASYYFNAYLESKLNPALDEYLRLIGGSAYYLGDLPGSSGVLLAPVDPSKISLGCNGVENLLCWLLKGDFSSGISSLATATAPYIVDIQKEVQRFFATGTKDDRLFKLLAQLQEHSYAAGVPRQALFADLVGAVAKKKYWNSSWRCLPQYSDLQHTIWTSVLEKRGFVKELWPAQHLIGKNKVFAGKSATIQMPTSAGKTRATEFIIRSGFLSGRIKLAVIVAPFRALCHEIKNSLRKEFLGEDVYVNELSDVLQMDIDSYAFEDNRWILVVTPEKLLYVLRHAPELATKIGLIIYDEGHQFDSGQRGVTYELLLASLQSMIPKTAQKVLISAVISNAEKINEWLNGKESVVVSGNGLNPTYRTVAFTSWRDSVNRLEFVTPDDPNHTEFYVPKIIEVKNLKQGRLKKSFPEPKGPSVALYLGLKLVLNGGVAVFCGTKRIVIGMCKELVKAASYGLIQNYPREVSTREEIVRLSALYGAHLGEKSTQTIAAGMGVLTHHANVPHGIRLSVEYAMKEGLVKFVVCTSTLAQGVNLPLKYLIVATTNQGGENIRVRDFHNLLGRAGRAGMYTEGSIIFSDPEIYNLKSIYGKNRRWRTAIRLLNREKAEPCVSSLLSIFKPFESDTKKHQVKMEPLDFAKLYYENPDFLIKFALSLEKKFLDVKFSKEGLLAQINYRVGIIVAIESYLMANADVFPGNLARVDELAKSTLAYYLATEKERANIVDLFKIVANNIEKKVPESERRKIFSKTLHGVRELMRIEKEVQKNADQIFAAKDADKLFSLVWPIIDSGIKHSVYVNWSPVALRTNLVAQWINGDSYGTICDMCNVNHVVKKTPKTERALSVEDIVDVCDGALSYEGMLLMGAIVEICENMPQRNERTVIMLKVLQKRMKYGLPELDSIRLYEIGFSDRIVAQEMSKCLHELPGATLDIHEKLIAYKSDMLNNVLKKYPAYFESILQVV